MKKNMGLSDKYIRIALAIVFGSLYVTNVVTGVLGTLLLIFGVIFLFTSLISYCPLYIPLKISTLKENKNKQ